MNDEKVDINRVRELITSYHKSVSQIKRYYERPSYMGLLNVGRKELPHSSFIKWLFSSSTFNQNSADSPIMHLLDIAVKRANQQDKIGDDKAISASLSDSIYGRLFSISNTSCSLEEVIAKRRCDIVIRCKIKDSERDLNICIENKVLSSEHTSQTEAYEQYYSNDENADWLFLFLTPLSSVELDDYFKHSVEWSRFRKLYNPSEEIVLDEHIDKAKQISGYTRLKLSSLPYDLIINSPESGSNYIISFSLANLRAETILRMLENKGILIDYQKIGIYDNKKNKAIYQTVREFSYNSKDKIAGYPGYY